jgi:prolyl-tRNA editing enzyme YbaK/EbsC (Cys-tRNA(Pro) deacylase)
MEQSANTIIVGSKKEPRRHCACVVRATRRVDVNHTVRKLLGVSRLSFADPEETRALTGMMLGGVTVFALPAGLPIYVDEGLMGLPWIILGGGSRSLKVKISPEVFRVLPGAVVTPGLVVEG